MSQKKTTKTSRKRNPKRIPGTYLNADLYDEWAKWCKDRGIVQQNYMSKIVEFIMDLDDSTRTMFLGEVTKEDRHSLARLILTRIASSQQGSGRKLNPPDSVIDDLLEQAGKPSSSEKDEAGSRRHTSPKRRGKAG